MISKTFDVPGVVSGIEMHRACILGNRAGIGSAHGRNLSAGSVDHRICRSDIGPRRIGSFQHLQNYGTRTRHGRTASDPTAEEVPQAAKINMGELRKPERSTPLLGTADGLKLGRSGEKTVVKLLVTIQALIPVDRMPRPVPPPPATCILAPACFLTPMAIVLVTLVWEREMLKVKKAKATLLVMRDRSRRQVSAEDGPGGVDWKIAQSYILAFGALLDSILPFLQNSSSFLDKRQVEELVKSARQYVAK